MLLISLADLANTVTSFAVESVLRWEQDSNTRRSAQASKTRRLGLIERT